MKKLAEKVARIAFAVMLTAGLMPTAAFADESAEQPDMGYEAANEAANEAAPAEEAAPEPGADAPAPAAPEYAIDSATETRSYNASPGWSQYGTCEWQISGGTLTIRPLNGQGEGTLGCLGYNKPPYDQPWSDSYKTIKKVVVKPGVRANNYSYYAFGKLEAATEMDLSGLDTSEASIMSSMFKGCKSLKTLKLSNFDTSKVLNMAHMFEGCESLTTLDVSSFNTAQVASMERMFEYCESLTTLNLSSFNTAKVGWMNYMFSGCKSLKSINLSSFNTAEVTTMQGMFLNCASLASLDLSTFNTSKVQNMASMFSGCESLKSVNISSFDTSSVWNMFHMFGNCKSLTSLDLSKFDTSHVSTMEAMFKSCYKLKYLDLSGFNTRNVNTMYQMFYYCESLGSLDVSSFDTSNVENTAYMFCGCKGLSMLDVSSFSMAKVKNVRYMFFDCKRLAIVRLPDNFIGPACTDATYLFRLCDSLTEIPANFSFGPNAAALNKKDAFSWNAVTYGITTPITTYYAGSDQSVLSYNWAADKRTLVRMSPLPAKVDRLAGGTRYDTMSLLAASGFEHADTVIVASGQNFPDALSASALAGTIGAPIALSDPKELSPQVRDVIARVGARNVIVVGGSAAVSDSVKAELDAIARARGGKCERVKGDDRFGTAIEVGKAARNRGAGATAIVANGDKFADSLSIAPYAYAKKAPLYLTGKDGNLGSATLDAIRAGGYSRVIIVGGASAVSPASERNLRSVAGTVERQGGSDRYETSKLIAKMALGEGMTCDGMAFASGKNFPDALASGPAAGRRNAVMLLVDGSASSSRAISEVVAPRKAGIRKVYLAGGRAAVPQDVAVRIGNALK